MVVIASHGFRRECLDFVCVNARPAHGLADAGDDKKGIAVLTRELHDDVGIFWVHGFAFGTGALVGA